MKKIKRTKRRAINSGDKVVDRLYNAVIDYVEKKGGTAMVVGGIAIVEEGREFNYGVMVRITGKKPEKLIHPTPNGDE